MHAQIDKLIGDEGLQSMRETHIRSGKYVLGCTT